MDEVRAKFERETETVTTAERSPPVRHEKSSPASAIEEDNREGICNVVISGKSERGDSERLHCLASREDDRVIVVSLFPGSPYHRSLSPSKLRFFNIVENLSPNRYFRDGLHPGFSMLGDGKQMIMCRSISACFHYSRLRPCDVRSGVVQPQFFFRRGFGFICNGNVDFVSRKDNHYYYHDGRLRNWKWARRYYCHYYSHLIRDSEEMVGLLQARRSGVSVRLCFPCALERDDITVTAELCRSRYHEAEVYESGWVIASILLGVEPWSEGMSAQR